MVLSQLLGLAVSGAFVDEHVDGEYSVFHSLNDLTCSWFPWNTTQPKCPLLSAPARKKQQTRQTGNKLWIVLYH